MPSLPAGRNPRAALPESPPFPSLSPGTPLSLAEGVELIGPYLGSGITDAPFLARRPNGQTVAISALLYAVAARLDGERTLDEIAALIAEELGRAVSAASIAYLVEQKLRPLGLISSTHPGAASPVAIAPAVLGLGIRVGVLPRSVVAAATKVLRPLFLPVVVASILAALVAADVWLLVGQHVVREMRTVRPTPALLLALVAITLAAGVFHELGHATASHYGGAEPGVIGIGIYVIWPVFFSDLNDTYRLDRVGRLRADLGGVYFNALVGLGLAGAYSVTRWPSLAVALAVQHIAVVQQFLPFLRLDGYYVVSDLAGVPDLFARIRPILASVVPGRPPPPSVEDLRPRARFIVTLWVLTTVPVLLACGALLVLTLPSVATASAGQLTRQARALVAAVAHADLVQGLASGVQLVVVAVPLVGLGVVVFRVGDVVRARWRRPGALPAAYPSPAPDATLPPTSPPTALRLGGLLVLVYLYLTSASLSPWKRTRTHPNRHPPSAGRSRPRPPDGSAGARRG